MSARGFTLIEVLVSLLIASLAAGALAGSTRAALRGAAATAERDLASQLAVEALEELLSQRAEHLLPLDDETVIDAAGERIVRRRTIEVGPAAGTWQIRVRARPETGGAEVTLATLRRAVWIRP